ncbi:hypothetical protein BATDEDRAFT_27332 [Batrachochytrium dendrobatidis JAM81]|uniref:Uncharacterized protein n=2 Tax=Batrachochytrium dendrobatidis TaxID=109871 RepID=F4PAI8_BATDJ|nr:uncharacterized protein BATDEDRAFT_27332 [Batrachochytrium dendrobatidis JAM81]EGF77547.1 hypothetical protein BATDEDRAFT_27332 [Batrachochytrium dendrobatidis JAM81]KAJ8323559.1 hypothetical protein O5D80_007871 [Batrachochytrium dendrobatidis]KAK5666118.1 hypothetical protein QVD99_006895 [Batrachochytrium dendrobatidis]OAJ43326.1 hypothetical protein BDEG_26693 [Batrachochytrium dendrobatidis JEL423]|eukprot:XP_006681654.1 hypothetical protein BATDEDRAFT_27332 [Batrachochytrium dendrobatidis JAM81]
MASRLTAGFVAGVLVTTTAYSLLQARIANDTELLRYKLSNSKEQVESVLPAHLQSQDVIPHSSLSSHYSYPGSLWPGSWHKSSATPLNSFTSALQFNTFKENWNGMIRCISTYLNGTSD